jgi:hypothetical protein
MYGDFFFSGKNCDTKMTNVLPLTEYDRTCKWVEAWSSPITEEKLQGETKEQIWKYVAWAVVDEWIDQMLSYAATGSRYHSDKHPPTPIPDSLKPFAVALFDDCMRNFTCNIDYVIYQTNLFGQPNQRLKRVIESLSEKVPCSMPPNSQILLSLKNPPSFNVEEARDKRYTSDPEDLDSFSLPNRLAFSEKSS